MNLTADEVLDARGLFCPEPVMLLHKAMRQMQAGQVLQVLATDPSTQRDIPKFCTFLEHSLLQADESEGQYQYWIRKKD